MDNTQQPYSYDPLPSERSELQEEDIWETLSLPDNGQRIRTAYFSTSMISLAAIVRQKRYRTLILISCLLIILYHFRPTTTNSFLAWNHTVTENEWLERSEKVKNAFLHAYNSYEKHAWGYDELLPATKGRINKSVCILHSVRLTSILTVSMDGALQSTILCPPWLL
jgi:hypothetical protein